MQTSETEYAATENVPIAQATAFADGDQVDVCASPTDLQTFQYYTETSHKRATKRENPYREWQQMYGRIYLP